MVTGGFYFRNQIDKSEPYGKNFSSRCGIIFPDIQHVSLCVVTDFHVCLEKRQGWEAVYDFYYTLLKVIVSIEPKIVPSLASYMKPQNGSLYRITLTFHCKEVFESKLDGSF